MGTSVLRASMEFFRSILGTVNERARPLQEPGTRNPRSGTTFTHRFLLGSGELCSTEIWEMLFPAISAFVRTITSMLDSSRSLSSSAMIESRPIAVMVKQILHTLDETTTTWSMQVVEPLYRARLYVPMDILALLRNLYSNPQFSR